MWNKNRAQNEKQASCICIYMYLCIYVSVTKAKLVSTSPLEVPREPFNVWFEYSGLGDCHHRIPREILGRNSGLTFVLARKLKISYFSHVTF